MKKEVITVPKDKCPLDVLAEMGEQIKDAWIFLHRNAFEKLKNSDGVSGEEERKLGLYVLTWEATEKYSETRLITDLGGLSADWTIILSISASDIAFNILSEDPEEIFFLKMDD